MEIILDNQSNTLGSILREKLEQECPEDFATCVVPEAASDFLLVTAPSVLHVRKALIECKESIEKIKSYINTKY